MKTLTVDVQEARAKAVARLIGRKQIDINALSQQPGPSSDAQRILDYLLELPHAEERRQMLPEAFAASEIGDQDGAADSAETEQLSTTPLQLLQVQTSSNPPSAYHLSWSGLKYLIAAFHETLGAIGSRSCAQDLVWSSLIVHAPNAATCETT